MSTFYGRSPLKKPMWIFDLDDRFARDLGVNGPHPPLLGDLQIRVSGEQINGGPQIWSQSPLLVTPSNLGGQRIFFGQVRLAAGDLRRGYLQDGHVYILRIESSYYQTIVRTIPFAPDPANPPAASSDYQVIAHTDPAAAEPNAVLVTLDLEPGFAYPFPQTSNYGPTLLRGHVQTTEGNGLANVQITVTGQPAVSYEMTGETGQWVLLFPDSQPAGDVTVQFTHNGTFIERVVAIEPGRVNILAPVEINV